MLILHANWSNGRIRLWGEELSAYMALAAADSSPSPRTEPSRHGFAVEPDQLLSLLVSTEVIEPDVATPCEMILRLPTEQGRPEPSLRLAAALGIMERLGGESLERYRVPAVSIAPQHTIAALLALEDRANAHALQHGQSLRYWIVAARFVLELLADQRFIPTLIQTRGDALRAAWQPWFHDRDIRSRVGALLAAMPAVARAVDDANQGRPWPILSEAMNTLADATVRLALERENFAEAIEDLAGSRDPHVVWLSGLLGSKDEVSANGEGVDLLRDARLWVGRLDETGTGKPLRLCLRLNEPIESLFLPDNEPVPDDMLWRLSIHLQAADDSTYLVDAEQVWNLPAGGQLFGQHRVDQPQELLLAELGRAARVYPRLEAALSEAAPTGINLTTAQAYEFLRDHRPVLEESGVRTIAPQWWNEPSSRLGARLQIDSQPLNAGERTPSSASEVATLGLHAIVQYRWQIAVGDQPLTMEEFQRLAAQGTPLVRVHGKWVEIRADDMERAARLLADKPGGEMTLLDAIHLAYGTDTEASGLPVSGLDATGWAADILGAASQDRAMEQIAQPPSFQGTLRPYQQKGLSWMAFLDRFGLGACLADDMGLGKTIQLIALLLHEREHDDHVGPTLLIAPTSVMSNWVRELSRFSPMLRVHVHHGPDRPMHEVFESLANESDVVITTYALVSRDRDTLSRVGWHRVALDEAQYIKNPPTKQTAAIRALRAGRRLALTGTPVENRLSELWSIMEFCNPGYLGGAAEFRSRFAVPIERHRDHRRAEALRNLVRPFVLRRLKTDPTVISDLPTLVESKEYATLTTEQASLYEATVNRMLEAVDRAEGIQRRGLVLATLVKLKQICNHPAQLLKEANAHAASSVDVEDAPSPIELAAAATMSRRSGKTRRLIELLEEVLASGERALVFTQFRRMGHLLTTMLQHDLNCETLFLHGGTPQNKRQQMIDRFQSDRGEAPVFVLSLKAGGVGLNLTAANHVFHFDRWWNPAVENQATDRAFRIGQTRSVHVHKFVCVGTLEERIDQMIEQKTELAQHIIGAGEQWLTELSTGQLQELLTLRGSGVEVEV